MKEQRLRWFAYLSVCLIGVVALAAVGMRYVLPVLLPFVLSWVLVMAVRPVACRIAERIGGSARVYRTLLSLLLVLGILLVFPLSGEEDIYSSVLQYYILYHKYG